MSSALVVLVFVHKRFRGPPDGIGDLLGDVLEHGVRNVEITSARMRADVPGSHPVIWSMTRAGDTEARGLALARL